ncbi:MAG: hypothetical protein HZC22_15105 [Rhodocyclales bacterium]|nr:hypothetical protein [Rhodocyclales bacterium]
MADYEQEGQSRDMDGSKAWCHVMYALHGISALGGVLGAATIVGSFLFGWPSIIAVVLNYITRGNVRGTWLESHWRWQLRTFWFTAAWAVAAALLVFTVIGIPFAWLILLVLGIWLLYRVIRGWLALADQRSMPLPA